MILIGELTKKKVHDHMHEDYIRPEEYKSIKRILTLRNVSHVPTKNILVIQSEENIIT